MPKSAIASNLLVFGVTHAVVDAACAGLLFAIPVLRLDPPEDFFYLVLLYNVLAFGFQHLCGRLSDHFQSPKGSAIAGCGLLAAATLVVASLPVIAVLLAGVGNAFFHVGGGTVSLNLTPNRASAPGIFVAPGAIGLATGILIGKSGYFTPLPFVLALAILCVGVMMIKIPNIDYSREDRTEIAGYFLPAMALLFVSVVIRSFVGLAIPYPWKADLLSLGLLTLAVAGGKAFGGILADRYGWLKVSVAALIVSAPLVALGMSFPWLGMVGMLLFNMTMAVTLVAIAGLLPGRPGFAFGVPCLALLIGALFTVTEARTAFADHLIIITVILVSAATLCAGLVFYSRFRSSAANASASAPPLGPAKQTGYGPVYDQ